MSGVIRFLRIPVWLGVITAVSVFIWRVVIGVLGSYMFAVPAVVAFVAFALMAGPPYREPPKRWKTRRIRIPSEVRRKMKRFGRITLWRKEKIELPGKRFAFFRFLALLGATCLLCSIVLLGFVKKKFDEGMPPDMNTVLNYDPAVSTRVYSADNELVCTFSMTDRVRVPYDRAPAHLRQAIVSAEDGDFYHHVGIDPVAIVRASLVNLKLWLKARGNSTVLAALYMVKGDSMQGASTITQQVVKQVILQNSDRTLQRKIQEIFLAVELTRRLTKEQVFEIYMNHLFLGHGSYGVEAAASTYFGKHVENLTLAESAMLAGLPQAPSRYSPYLHYDKARARMRYVLDQMMKNGFITAEERATALAQEIAIISQEDPLNHTAAPYFCDLTRRELKRMFGNQAVFGSGLTVHSTLDMSMQRAAEASVRGGLIDLERRIRFDGPVGHDDEFKSCAGDSDPVADDTIYMANVVAVTGKVPTVCVRGNVFPVHPDDASRIASWETQARKKLAVGDQLPVKLTTLPVTKDNKNAVRYATSARRTGGVDHPEALQAAIIAVDPHTGYLRALVGGYDFVEDQVNFATMEKRQPGSSIKPYLYLTALMGTDTKPGLTVDATVVDTPRCYQTASGTWCPRNYDDKFMGSVPMRTALAQSLNSVSVDFAARYGVDNVIRTMRKLGIASPLERVLPLAVGAADITPWEHTYAYASIAAGGKVIPRHPGAERAGVFITKVTAGDGRTLFEYKPVPREEWSQAVPAADAYALTYLMRGVVEEGTGRRVRELRRPAAGKTGTTNELKDVWFMGFTTDMVMGTWVGRKRPDTIGTKATGGVVALPIWLAAMKAWQAEHPEIPTTDFPVPDDIALLRNEHGDLIPYQRGRLPNSILLGTVSGNFADDKSPF